MYFTLLCLHHRHPSIQPFCWKGHSQFGSYIHYWWHCRAILNYWTFIKQQIFIISGYDVPLQPETMPLNLWPSNKIPKSHRILIHYLCAAAHFAIPSVWKSISPLSAWHKKKLGLPSYGKNPSDVYFYWRRFLYICLCWYMVLGSTLYNPQPTPFWHVVDVLLL